MTKKLLNLDVWKSERFDYWELITFPSHLLVLKGRAPKKEIMIMEQGSWRITKVVHFIKELTVSTASCTLIDYHSFSFSYDRIISASSTCTSNLQAHSTSQGSPIDCWPSSDTNPSRLGSHRWQRVKGTLTLPYRVIPVVGTLKLKTVYRNSSIKPTGGIFLSYTFFFRWGVGGGGLILFSQTERYTDF